MQAVLLAVGLLLRLQGQIDDFAVVATIEKGGLYLVLQHPRETYPDCSTIGVVGDRGAIPSTVQIERGGPTCGPEGREVFTLRIERADLPAIQRAKTLAIDVCGTQLAVNRKWLTNLRQLVAKAPPRALEDK